MLEGVGTGRCGRANIRHTEGLANTIERRIAVKPLPGLAGPEIIRAVRAPPAWKRTKSIGGVHYRRICFYECAIRPPLIALLPGIRPILGRIRNQSHIRGVTDEGCESRAVAKIVVPGAGIDDEVDVRSGRNIHHLRVHPAFAEGGPLKYLHAIDKDPADHAIAATAF